MNFLINLAKLAALVSLTLLCIVSTLAVGELRGRSLALVTDVNRVVLSVGGTAAEVRKAAKEGALASQEQRVYWQNISKQMTATLSEAHLVLENLNEVTVRTNESLNRNLFPQATASLKSSSEDFHTVSVSTSTGIEDISRSSQEAIANLSKAVESLDRRIADPHLDQTVANLDRASANVAEATGHLNESSALIEGKVRQVVKPAGFLKTFGIFILKAASSIGSIAGGLF